MVGAGSRYETRKNNGISHFLEHMAFKGTKKRPTAQIIASTIEGIGAEFNAYTSKDHTGYYIKAAKKHLPLLIDVLSDMLLNSKYDTVEIEKEKGVIIEEIRMYEDMPMRKIGDLYENLLYGDTPLGRDIAGTEEVIRQITREDFVTYVENYYAPGNTVVVLAGAVEEMSAGKLLEEKLGKWKKKGVPAFEKHPNNQSKPELLLHHKDTEQAHLSLGVRSYCLTDKRRYSLGVLSNILGGGMSSRLFTEVREKRGLAYYVRASGEYYQDVGNFLVQAGVDVSRIDDAIKVIIEELLKITDGKIKDEELIRSKEHLKGHLILDLEDSKQVAGIFANSELLEGKIRTPDDVLNEIEKVSLSEVQKIACDLFSKNRLNLAVIGPYKEKAKFEKLLK